MLGSNEKDDLNASSIGAQTLSTPAGTGSKRDNLDIQEKYRKLKKRFFELEEKYKELTTELQKSGERNVRIREERDQLLERIMELEQQGHGSPGSSSVALPRTLLSARARSSFEENLRNAMEEEEEEEADDVLLHSRHTTSPSARREHDGSSGTRRSTRTSNGKAKANASPTGPRTRSKRSAPDGGASPSAPKRHKSQLSLSTGSADNTQPPAGGDEPMSGEAMHEDRGNSVPLPHGDKQHDELDSAPSPEAEPLAGDVAMQDEQPPTSLLDTEEFNKPSPPATTSQSAVTQNIGGPTPHVAATSSLVFTQEPSANPAQSQSPHPTEQQPSSIDPNLGTTTSTSNQNGTTGSRAAVTQPATSNGSGAHPLSGNPYLSLSTIMVPKPPPNGAPGQTPTTAHPLFMNPYMYYPSPITPVTGTPNTPSYPYNPYFYLTAPPMMPGPPPPGMFPPPPQNNAPPPTPTSSTQSRPPQPIDPQQPRPKAKRLKAHTVTSKNYSIPLVPRDKHGKPMLPLNVGIMTVINLGTVCLREHFHTERYIFPVGYEVTRRYLSTINPNIEVVYHCTILDGGDGPKFQIVPSDTPDKPVIAGTATGAWSSIVKQANAIRNRQHSNSVSGPDFFGLGQNTIKHLIQQLPGAEGLRDYVWQNFIEGGPLGGRHAAVIPALPEEYDAALPRGAVYHSPLERQRRLLEQQASPSPGELPKGLSHYPQHIIAQAASSGQPVPGQQQPLPPHVQQSVQHAQLQHQQAMQQMQDARLMFVPMDSQPTQQQQELQQQFMQQQQIAGQVSSPHPQLVQSPPPGPAASGSGLATPAEGLASPPQPAPASSETPPQASGPVDGMPSNVLPHGLSVPGLTMQHQPPQQQQQQQPSLPQPQAQQVTHQQQPSMTQQPTPITPSTSAPSLASLMQAYQSRPPPA